MNNPNNILSFLMNDTIVITDQTTQVSETFSPVRVRTSSNFSQMPYGMDNDASWQIWFDSKALSNFNTLLEYAKINNVVSFTLESGETKYVRITSVNYLKTNMSNIHHVKVACI